MSSPHIAERAKPMKYPNEPTDPFSDVLRSIRLNGCIFFEVAATTRWVAEAPSAQSVVDIVRPGAHQT